MIESAKSMGKGKAWRRWGAESYGGLLTLTIGYTS